MATNFNIANINGIGKSSKLETIKIEDAGRSIDLSASVKNTKDPIYICVDLTGALISCRLEVLDENGSVTKIAQLFSKGMNVVPMSTYGDISKDGKINLRLSALSGELESNFNITVGAFSHIPVINN